MEQLSRSNDNGIRLDPSELPHEDILIDFLFQCNDRNVSQPDALAEFIVSTLGDHADEGTSRADLQRLAVDILSFDEEYTDELRLNDDVLNKIYDMILRTRQRSVDGKTGLTPQRKALLYLLDLRAGVDARYDRKTTDEPIEQLWHTLLNKLA